MGFVGIRDRYAESGKPQELLERYGLMPADIIRAAASPTPEAQALAATELWHTVQQTNFPLRATAIAQEIQETRPDLIGEHLGVEPGLVATSRSRPQRASTCA